MKFKMFLLLVLFIVFAGASPAFAVEPAQQYNLRMVKAVRKYAVEINDAYIRWNKRNAKSCKLTGDERIIAQAESFEILWADRVASINRFAERLEKANESFFKKTGEMPASGGFSLGNFDSASWNFESTSFPLIQSLEACQ